MSYRYLSCNSLSFNIMYTLSTRENSKTYLFKTIKFNPEENFKTLKFFNRLTFFRGHKKYLTHF
jgi:hypothetical protein